MTNRKGEADSFCRHRLATPLAVDLVSQVLEEAYFIANAASESGQPWRYWTMLKELKSCNLVDVKEVNAFFNNSKEESIETNNNDKIFESNKVSNNVATSTPQKVLDEIQKLSNNNLLIGQGDEEFSLMDTHQKDYETSTSMFINNLFDMSEIERMCDETNLAENNEPCNDLLTNAMATIINTALEIALGHDSVNTQSLEEGKSLSTEHSGYSFLDDANDVDEQIVLGDVEICVENQLIQGNVDMTSSSVTVTEMIKETNGGTKKADPKSDVTRFENAYLTLNRDYDQCSEDDSHPVLHDPKGMVMQEVELITLQPLNEISAKDKIEEEENKLISTSAVAASISSRKSSLVRRCRTQGARLLACLRGWWRRKTPGKRKESRVPGSVRGFCPLSPDARRRAASLLDHRRLCSSTTLSQQGVWKFNTVSESLVNSNQWKNYTFDINPQDYGEY